MTKESEQPELRPNQVLALEALLTGQSQQDAAASAGVDPRTLRRWSQEDEAFKEALEESTAIASTSAARRLAGTLDRAADVLQEILTDPTVPPQVRLRAANAAINHSLKLTEHIELEKRIAILERKLFGEDP